MAAEKFEMVTSSLNLIKNNRVKGVRENWQKIKQIKCSQL